MMNKKIISSLIFSLLVLSSSAQVIGGEQKEEKEQVQEENQEATGTTTPMFQEYQSWSADAMGGLFFPSSIPLLFYSFGVYPRYNFIAPKDYLTVSVGSPLNLGFSFSAGSYGTLVQFMGDIPLTVDLNIGSRATPFDESLFGAYIGAGFNYNYMFFQINEEKANIHTFGPTIHGGFRWEINGRQTGFRVSYLRGFGTADETIDDTVVEGSPGNRVFSISAIYGIK